MHVKRVACGLVGHRWKRHRLPDHTVKSTCQRCGRIEFGDDDDPDWRAQHIVGGGGPAGPG
jgi:hypothetical protein